MTRAAGATASSPKVAFFTSVNVGHFRRCLPIIEACVRQGADVVVFTEVAFAAGVRSAGAQFVDLFYERPIDADDSVPYGSREVTFAGRFGKVVIEEVRAHRPDLVITDSFAVIGRLVADALGLPYASLRAGHNTHRERFRDVAASHPRLHISDACRRAVETLRDEHGMTDASPFAQVAPLSPHLNVYGEPPQFLSPQDRRALEPVVFFGSLPSVPPDTGSVLDGESAFPAAAEHKVYVSFGTIACRLFPQEAVAALRAITAAIGERPAMAGLVSLGGVTLDPGIERELARPNVRIERSVDQWRVLAEADAFVTHHGLNSTHEAIFQGVPMVSYPFWWDQPALARRCQELDLAVALTDEVRSPLDAGQVHRALDRLQTDAARLRRGLGTARSWEDEVIGRRADAMRTIMRLVR